jgi:hypothetical protein
MKSVGDLEKRWHAQIQRLWTRIMLSTTEQTAIIHDRLKRCCWNVGDFAAIGLSGKVVWIVSGVNGENGLRVEGRTSLEA